MRVFLLLMLAVTPPPSEDSVTEITLERSPCKGTCPVDKVVLRSDGTASYTGTEHVKLRGVYKGNLAPRDFEELTKLVSDDGFFELQGRYQDERTCAATLTTTVRRGTGTKTVSNYGDAAPESLRHLENRIIELIGKVEWKLDTTAP